MAKVGFKINSSLDKEKKSLAAEETNIKNVEKFLKDEKMLYDQEVSQIKAEMKEIKHVKHNLSIITSQFKRLEHFVQKKENLLHDVLLETSKSRTKADPKKALDKIRLINDLDMQIFSMTNKLFSELDRLILKETHELYSQTQKSKEILENISREGTSMMARIKRISSQVNNDKQQIFELENDLKKFVQEREDSEFEKNRPKAGFKQ
ncbi:MAG: hypothetical protein ACOCQQ_00285 [Candidatus Nanoarchaeia archaeon]